MIHDHKVDFLSKDLVAKIALQWREKALSLERGEYLVTAKFILAKMIGKYFKKEGKELKLNVYDNNYSEKRPAFVTFDNFTLNVAKTIWDKALEGYPEENYILAHELGHIILHNHYTQAFLNDSKMHRQSTTQEFSAEWQANAFASFFLLPEQKIKLCYSSKTITSMFGLPENIVDNRINDSIENKKYSRTTDYTSDLCTECGKMSVVREGNNLICINCKPPFMLSSPNEF